MVDVCAGVHYPSSLEEFVAWFSNDEDCYDYLDWLRWADGFACPSTSCDGRRSWRRSDLRRVCAECSGTVSATAGTIFSGTRTPLSEWFAAAWQMTTAKNGVSAMALKRELSLGSYQTAWTMLHRYRSAMVRPERTQLSGDVEVDETFVGGPRPGKRGRGAHGKTIVLVAVELRNPKGYGRCRLAVAPNTNGSTILRFVRAHVAEGSVVITDGLNHYSDVGTDPFYTHKPINLSASELQAHEELPGVHRVASLLKRWILGTHQGSADPAHLQAYLDEFVFRFNRRHSHQRGLLFYRLLEGAVSTGPLTYAKLAKTHKPKKVHPTPPENPQRSRHRYEPLWRPWREGT